ncbi:MAG: lycopene beta-cyclase [Saprospiraceae bacterium]|jgi:lycopene beta-cyclase
MDSTVYNYVIIGAGCAGLHLAMAMIDDPFFADKQVLILEKESKAINDRTWCFWEIGAGKWDQLIHHSWSRGKFNGPENQHQLDMAPYRYKMLRSIDFYTYGKSKIKKAPNFHWVNEQIEDIVFEENQHKIIGQQHNFFAAHIFDSRIDPAFYTSKDSYTRILQHFKGWLIETDEDFFDPEEFVIMDYRLKWKNSTSFNYVLPISKRKALVEFTLFTPELIRDKQYDQILSQYLKAFLGLKNYTIVEVEQGIIPMSDYPFHKHHLPHLTKIGTAGGWVRPSSGYHFKNAEKYSRQIINNIKKRKLPAAGIAVNRFRKYDTLLLDILKNHNELGEELFTSMFEKNPATQIFKFLDEETTLLEDFKIITSFRSKLFLQAILHQIR